MWESNPPAFQTKVRTIIQEHSTFLFFVLKMNEQMTNFLYAVHCLQYFCCVYSIRPNVRVQNELGSVAGEAILST